MKKLSTALFLALYISCNSDPILPKPKGYLSLKYPAKEYKKLTLKRPYSFDVAKKTTYLDQKNKWMKIFYPTLKASVDITYRPINNNLRQLLIESEKLVYEHTIKAEKITPKDYINPKKRVFGSLYAIAGDAASNVQFHVTDSTKHFLKGSLFFYTKPNYDSILPAIAYIKEDMIRIMETLEWKNSN